MLGRYGRKNSRGNKRSSVPNRLKFHLFVTHGWAEVIFDFIDKVVVGIGRQIAGRDGNCEVKVKFVRPSHRRLGAKKHSTFVTFREIKSKIFTRSASRHNSSELVNC